MSLTQAYDHSKNPAPKPVKYELAPAIVTIPGLTPKLLEMVKEHSFAEYECLVEPGQRIRRWEPIGRFNLSGLIAHPLKPVIQLNFPCMIKSISGTSFSLQPLLPALDAPRTELSKKEFKELQRDIQPEVVFNLLTESLIMLEQRKTTSSFSILGPKTAPIRKMLNEEYAKIKPTITPIERPPTPGAAMA